MNAQKLFEILDYNEVVDYSISEDNELISIETDSRKCTPNSVFVAVQGYSVDGHDFINQAINNGASLVICDRPISTINVDFIQVEKVRKVLGQIAHGFYGNDNTLKIVGITGTNGKSTVATLLYQLFMTLGHKVGLISTVEIKIGTSRIPSTHTTPDAVSLAKILAKMRAENCTHIFMEVSSHGIVQGRIDAIPFTGGVFTNITHDHLDFHGNMLNYINAKKMFFDQLDSESFALVNSDDRNGSVMIQECLAKKYSYALKTMSDYKVRIIQDSLMGLHIKLNEQEIYCRLSGEFNAYNIAAVYGVARLLDQDAEESLKGISQLDGAEGRMQKVMIEGVSKIGIVDYAHTPDALKNVLQTLNKTKRDAQNVVTVIGCGGDRDVEKRPKMAKIAVLLSQTVILTSDNPRSEDPEKILDDMENGIEKKERVNVIRITDRKSAIRTAVKLANENDVILVAGKGHEKYQEIKGSKLPFEDKKILLESLQESI